MLRRIGIVLTVIAVTSTGIAGGAWARGGGGHIGGGGHVGGGFTGGQMGGGFGGGRGPLAGNSGERLGSGRDAFTSRPSGLRLHDGRRGAPRYGSGWGSYDNCWPYDYTNPYCYY